MIGIALSAVGLIKARIGRHVDLATDDGVYPLGAAGKIKGDHTVHHAVIGHGNGILSAFLYPFGNIGNAACAVQ